jgi:hypothetical protein
MTDGVDGRDKPGHDNVDEASPETIGIAPDAAQSVGGGAKKQRRDPSGRLQRQ